MGKKEKILKPVKSAAGGVFLPHLKSTADNESVIMPPPAVVKIPLSQHIGAPAVPVVKAGDKVFVGTLIGEAPGFVSASVHSSVSGKVKEITDVVMNGEPVKCVVIESDGEMEKDPSLKPFEVNSKDDVAAAANYCGLVGLGGAGFPSRVKLTIDEKTKINTLIINGAECEPYITSDYRECIENYDDIFDGIYLLKEKLGIKRVFICVESNKKRAVEKFYAIAADQKDKTNGVRLMVLPTKYPQGAEKVIIYSATGRKIPAGKLPSDAGCIVMNITSVGTLSRFVKTGMPLVSKRVTVDGTAVNEPKNVIVPIGTSVKELLDFAGGISEDTDKILMGGPMMGSAVCDENAVVEKRTNGITVLKKEKTVAASACIKCGRCARACPMKLYPASVDAALNHNLTDALKKLNVNYCMECGCCAFVCPAKRPLTQTMRLAKAKIRREQKNG